MKAHMNIDRLAASGWWSVGSGHGGVDWVEPTDDVDHFIICISFYSLLVIFIKCGNE